MRGVSVDLSKLMTQQEKNITVGNTQSNARGDQLGRGGRVVKSADSIAREHYNQNPAKPVVRSTIKVDAEKKATKVEKQMEDDWMEPEVTEKAGPDPIIIKKEEPEVDPNFNTDADPWIEDADGNFVRASELAERMEDESVSKSKKSKSK